MANNAPKAHVVVDVGGGIKGRLDIRLRRRPVEQLAHLGTALLNCISVAIKK